MTQSKYLKPLEKFRRTPLFTVKEAISKGIPRHAIAYFVNKGDLERVYPGAYRFSDYEPEVEFKWENLALMATSVPKSVICLISALYYYDLTDQMIRETWLAIPHGSYSPKRPNTRIVRMRNISLGKTQIILGEHIVQIFDRERCIIDAFRYLGNEIAIKSLQKYFQNPLHKPDLKKINRYAKKLRVNITPYILSYTT